MAVPRNVDYTVYTGVQTTGSVETINATSVRTFLADNNGNIVICTGSTVPPNGSSGFAAAGLFLGTTILWVNAGTTTSSTFTPSAY